MYSLLLGAIAGDICGSSYEHTVGRTKNYDSVQLIRTDNDFTDDTVCTIGIAAALIENPCPTAEEFGKSLQKYCKMYPHRGYGGMFKKWIDNPVPYNSYGNGSAMRVSPCGLFARSEEECLRLAKRSAECSHNHPEGIKGAQAIALAVFYADGGLGKNIIREGILNKYYPDYSNKTLDDIRPDYHFDATCQGSVPIALLAFLESKDYEDCLKLAISMGGDSDTIAAMAGGIALPYYGAMIKKLENATYNILPEEILDVIEEFEDYI